MSKSLFIFTPSLKFGGAEKALVTLANSLEKSGYNVTYCYGEHGELEKDLRDNIVKINVERSRMISSALPLYKILTKNKPDVIITTLIHCNIMLLLISFFYNLFNKQKIEVIIRETTNIALRLEQMSYIKRLALKLLMKVCYPRAKAVVFPSKNLKTKFITHFNLAINNGVVIYNSSFLLAREAKEINEIIIQKDKKITLLSVGRLTKTKRVGDLFYAVKRLPTKIDIQVDIIGAGPDEKNLRELAKHLNIDNIVNFKGFLSQPFSSYYKKNAVFVLTSELEGMPNSLIEALLSGLPCISTKCEFGPDEIFKIFEISKYWLYTPGNTNELTALLLNIFDSNNIYKINLKKGCEELSLDKLLHRYKQIID